MSNGYKNQPISGFTGYIPGAKWQVGSRYVPQQQPERQQPKAQQKRDEYDQSLQIASSANQSMSQMKTEDSSINQKHFSEMSNEELREKLSQMQMDMQHLQLALNKSHNDYDSEEYMESRNNRNGQQQQISNRNNMQNQEMKQRSKSVPRRVEPNPFDGIESGWWSKGEVKRNQERRQIANGGQIVSGGNWSQRPPSQQRQSRKFRALDREEAEDIPAAGYSGHIQGLRQVGVGKPFNIAAKQAKKEYIERRRTYSGSRDIVNGKLRGVQYSDEEVLTNTVKLPDNHFS